MNNNNKEIININEEIINIKISNHLINNLLPYQIQHVQSLIYSLNKYNVALDLSDTGTGKMYCGTAISHQLNLRPFIICPKSTINSWFYVCNKFGVKPLGIVNYESIKNRKYYNENKERVDCPYIWIDKSRKDYKRYVWLLNNPTLFIFDEVHKSRNHKTQNSNLLAGIKDYLGKNKLLMLSASITDKPEQFKPIAYLLNFFYRYDNKEYQGWKKSIKNILTNNNNVKLKLQKINNNLQLSADDKNKLRKKIFNEEFFIYQHNQIFPRYASRMTIEEIKKLSPSLFPINTIKPISYKMVNENSIRQQYLLIDKALNDLKNNNLSDHPLALIMKARQQIELLKIPTVVDKVKNKLNKSKSVVIFVNFKKTMKLLGQQLGCNQFIYGGQNNDERTKIINDFQSDINKLLIVNIKAGGVGISLHGKNPRCSFILPSYSSIDLLQALGRINRAGVSNNIKQYIVFCDNTIENTIMKRIKEKLSSLALLNDNDLQLNTTKSLIK